MEHGAPAQILLVEDSPGDVNLTIEALRSARVANDLHVVGDGEAAMAFVRGEPPYADVPRPDLVLLDLGLPLKDGREVLAEMKGDPALQTIPVIVLTISELDVDILRAYELHANGYVTKPVEFEQFIQALRELQDFWLSIVRLPPHV